MSCRLLFLSTEGGKDTIFLHVRGSFATSEILGSVPFPRRVRDGDPHGRRLRHGGSVALGGSAALVQYSPARRTYFVRDDCVAGTRPVPETLCYEDCGGAGCKPQYNGKVWHW